MTHEQFKEKLAATLEEVVGCPCNYSPLDEEICEWCCDKYGDCAEISTTVCWLRVFERIEVEGLEE